MSELDRRGVALLVGNAGIALACGALALNGWWWMAPFSAMNALFATAVARELWIDRP